MRPIEIFIQRHGVSDIAVANMAPERTVAELLASLEQPVGREEGFLVFLEDASAPIEVEAVLEELLPLAGADEVEVIALRLHLARCRHIEVSVRYNGEEVKRRFPPGATVARVHHWAARRAFHLTPRDSAEHVLQIKGTATRPDRDVHIGTLVDGKTCDLAFDLVPRKRVEG